MLRLYCITSVCLRSFSSLLRDTGRPRSVQVLERVKQNIGRNGLIIGQTEWRPERTSRNFISKPHKKMDNANGNPDSTSTPFRNCSTTSTWSMNSHPPTVASTWPSSPAASAAAAAGAGRFQPLPSPSINEPRRWSSVTEVGARKKREPLEPLLVEVLHSAGGQGLVLTDVYRQVLARGADYPDAGDERTGAGGGGVAWRKNVRHILTVRDFFVKTGVRNPDGRGQYWRFDERKYDEYVTQKRRPIVVTASDRVTDGVNDVTVDVSRRNEQLLQSYAASTSAVVTGVQTRCYLAPINNRLDADSRRWPPMVFRSESGDHLGAQSPTMNSFQPTDLQRHHLAEQARHQCQPSIATSDDVIVQRLPPLPRLQKQRPSCMYQQQLEQQPRLLPHQSDFILQRAICHGELPPSATCAVPFQRDTFQIEIGHEPFGGIWSSKNCGNTQNVRIGSHLVSTNHFTQSGLAVCDDPRSIVGRVNTVVPPMNQWNVRYTEIYNSGSGDSPNMGVSDSGPGYQHSKDSLINAPPMQRSGHGSLRGVSEHVYTLDDAPRH